jgi:molybdopterin-guanine dinucleotide biosynthesis protein A
MSSTTEGQPFTVAIIAGGKSTRMGTDKAFVRLDGKPLIAHVLARVATLGAAAMILITNHPDSYGSLGLPMFPDVIPDKGSLGGIYTALTVSQHAYTQVIACDTPFVQPELLAHLLTLREGHEVIVPTVKGYPQGLHGLYHKACLGPMRERMDANRLNVIGFYPQVRVRTVDEAEYEPFDPTGVSFFNVNTPDQLAYAVRIVAGDPYVPSDDPS